MFNFQKGKTLNFNFNLQKKKKIAGESVQCISLYFIESKAKGLAQLFLRFQTISNFDAIFSFMTLLNKDEVIIAGEILTFLRKRKISISKSEDVNGYFDFRVCFSTDQRERC